MDVADAMTIVLDYLERNPVRSEMTGERNLDMSNWLRKRCRPSKAGCVCEGQEIGCMVVSDLDFVLWDYKKRTLQLIECKTNGGSMRFAQVQLLNVLDACIRAGADKAQVTYLGKHVLRMSGTTPDNSEFVYWDDRRVGYMELWQRINMLAGV